MSHNLDNSTLLCWNIFNCTVISLLVEKDAIAIKEIQYFQKLIKVFVLGQVSQRKQGG